MLRPSVRIARRPIIRPRQFPAFVGLSLMVGYRTDHHPLVMQSWLRKRRTICRAKPSRIQPPGRFVCGRRSPGRRVWTPVGRGDPPHGAATRRSRIGLDWPRLWLPTRWIRSYLSL